MDGSPAAPHIITREEAAAELMSRRKLRSSLHEFIKGAWPQFEGGRDFQDGWAIGAIAEHLEAVVRGQIRNLLVNQPPRTTKSSLIGVCMVPWAWIEAPGLQIVSTSYSDKLSMRDHLKARRLIESQWYQTRWGNVYQLMGDQNTKIRYDNSRGGYRVATSVDGANTGEGGDIIIIDDPNNARDLSDVALNSVLTWWREVMPSRLNDFKTGRRIVVQQRVHEKDVSGEIIANGGKDWVKLILPMEFESRRRCVTVALPSTDGKKWQDPRKNDGDLLWPERIDAESLRRLKNELASEYAIAGQLQQRPSPGEGGIIKRHYFKVWKQSEPPKIEYSILSVDTALSESDAAAYNAATTWGVFRDHETKVPQVILLSSWRKRCEYPELRERIKRMALDYLDDGDVPRPPMAKKLKPTVLLIEAKNSGISLIQELARSGLTPVRFNPDKLGDKTMRVRLITPLLESGRVWVPGMAPDFKRLRNFASVFVEQACGFPRMESRDLVDTMTQALWRLQSSGFVWVSGDPGEPEEYTNGEVRGAIY